MSIPTLEQLHAIGAAQQPTYPDQAAVTKAVERLRTVPPLVFAGECDELKDKIAADNAVLAAGGTVFHAGVLSDDPASPGRTVGLDAAPPFDLTAKVSRETVAAAMLDEAETPRFPGAVALPLPG